MAPALGAGLLAGGREQMDNDGLPRVTRPDDLPRSPTGRIPAWVIDEVHGSLALPPEPWRSSPTTAIYSLPPARRPAVRIRSVLTLAAVLTAVLVASWMAGAGLLPPPPGLASAAGSEMAPTPGHEAAPRPLGAPAPVAGVNGSYRFIDTQADGETPVAYDPCRPIHYVVRAANVPAGGHDLLAAAIANVSAATGLRFVNDGVTTEAADLDREPYQPDRYGDRWAPVLIAWVTPEESPDLAARVAGQAGSMSLSVDGSPQVYVTGAVQLDAPQLAGHLAHPGGAALVQATIEHELGHLVGLDHVDDGSQLMYPEASGDITGFGEGDLTGLAALGQGACVPEL